MMNMFGNLGGFDLLLDIMENCEAGEKIDINSLCYMSTMVTMPIALWHKDWIKDFAERFGRTPHAIACRRYFTLY